MARTKTVSIPLSVKLAKELPSEPSDRQKVLELGLKEWRVRLALEEFKAGRCTLAAAAERAGVALREIIPLAYAHGLGPKADTKALPKQLSIEQASRL